jgi:hypothetical protein
LIIFKSVEIKDENMPFDDSKLGKPLEAQVRAETESSNTRTWVSSKIDEIRCKFASGIETVQNVAGCLFCKK